MKEYYVTHSKYRNNNRKSWENALTFAFDGPIAKVQFGTYNYYHNGDLIWSKDGAADLWKNFEDVVMQYDYDEVCDMYPIYNEYSNDCQAYVKKEMGW